MIELEFSKLPDRVLIELDDSMSPKTVAAIFDSLPIRVMINRWGGEFYAYAIPAKVGRECRGGNQAAQCSILA